MQAIDDQITGHYAVEYHEKVYHGNVNLKEHHLFSFEEQSYLFRIQDMAVIPISRSLAATIGSLVPGQGSLIDDELFKRLKACELVSDAALPDRPSSGIKPLASGPVETMVLFLNQTCNLRCIYCFGDAGEYGHREVMSFETAAASIDWLLDSSLDAGNVFINFFGGEPLLSFPLLKSVVLYAKSRALQRNKKISFSVSTNATVLDDEMLSFLSREGVEPLISFDGPPEIQNRQRPFRNGRGSFNRVVENIGRLQAVFPNLTARATVCAESDPFEVRKGIEKAGFTGSHLSPASPVIGSGGSGSTDRETRKALAKRLLEYHLTEVERLFNAIRAGTITLERPPAVLAMLALLAEKRKRLFACGIGREMLAVSASGDIYPCHRFVGHDDKKLGHVSRGHSVGHTDFPDTSVDNLPVCRFCWARYFCGGGCFYHNQSCTGDMHDPDPLFCHDIKKVCERLLSRWCSLEESEKAWLQQELSAMDSRWRL